MDQLLKLLFLVIFLGGCKSDYTLTPILDFSARYKEAPDISVYPTAIDFGTLNADGETATEKITIVNIGSDLLVIDRIELTDGSNVFITSALNGSNEIKSLERVVFTVTYDPETYEFNNNFVNIYSNDSDEPHIVVELRGAGDAPVINIEPKDYDFGYTLVECEETLDVTVSNIGNADLIIDRIDYFITYPANLAIEDYENIYGPLPWTLRPNQEILLEIYYYPTDIDVDYGELEVYSNDPLTSIATADQTAIGVYEPLYEETFDQLEVKSVDILFVIDNSCSMSGNQTQLSNNFDTFMNVYVTSGVDYNIGFITTDSYVSQGMVSVTTVDPVTEVQNIINSIGITGSTLERGLYYSYYALQSGYDFGPGSVFWRNDSKLIIIYISDEDDQSSALGVTPIMVRDYVTSQKSGVDYSVAHAVAGDYPGGCSGNGSASEAYEYYTVVNYLNGTFLSICQTDWGTPLESLANESILKTSFELKKEPIESTIYIEVDGVTSTEWAYDAIANTINFNKGYIPEAKSTIYASYNPASECP